MNKINRFNYDTFLDIIDKTPNGHFQDNEPIFTDFLQKYLDTNIFAGTAKVGDKGIDAVYFVTGTNKLTLFQFKLGKKETKLNKDDVEWIRQKTKLFIEDIKNMQHNNKELAKASTAIHRGQISEIDLIVFTTSVIMRGIHKHVPDFVEVDGKNIQFNTTNYQGKDFYEMIHKLKTEKSFNESVKGKEMVFPLEKGGYIEHSKDEGYTLKVPATYLYDEVLKTIDSSQNLSALTHKNVRDFMGYKKDDENNISNGIYKTLTTEDGKDLYAYHMGMVVLCEDLVEDKDNGLLRITSPSFVNGAQSLGTLITRTNKNTLSKDASFTIRFLKSPNTDKESKIFADKVVLRTNSSNPITDQMRYAFDPKQPLIARMFEDRGIYYDYRAAETKAKNFYKASIKETTKIIEFDNEAVVDSFKKSIKKDVKPDEIAAAIYAIQKKDHKAQRSNKNVFRYSSASEAEYYEVFYKDGKLRSFNEYFVPYASQQIFLERMKNIFTVHKDSVVINYKQKQFKLDFNQAKKIQWLLFIDFIKEFETTTLEEYVNNVMNMNDPYSDLKVMIDNYLNLVNNDLMDKTSLTTTIKKYLVKNSVTNMADAAR